MSKCCNCVYTLPGCYNICEPILIELDGIADGTYWVDGGYYRFQATATDGVLTIPANVLNESACAVLSIEGYTLEADGKEYDCIKFKTTYSVQIESGGFVPPIPTPPPSGNDTNFANANLTFDANRVHDLNGFSAIIREPGVHSLQLGADVPAGMIPVPNLKFSGFTGSNAADRVMTLNGLSKGVSEIEPNTYLPTIALFKGDPLGSGGSLMIYSLETDSDGDAAEIASYDNTNIGLSVNRVFIKGNYFLFDANTDEVNWFLGRDGRFRHDGAYANNGYQNYTAGGSVTVNDNVSYFIYNPATVQSGATITLPANPIDGQTLYIFGGGTVTVGNVITGFTLDGNGFPVIGDGASTLKVGKAIELHFFNGIWYALSF